jgi:hypothetical protein
MMRISINISLIVLFFIASAFSSGTKEKNYNSIKTNLLKDSTCIISIDTINIYPKDDNHDTLIPKRNRIWWYSELKKISTENPTIINVSGDGWRGGKYVVPVYSYDNELWYRFQDSEIVDKKGADALWNYSLKKQFDLPNVNIARTYPYFPDRIEKLLNKNKRNIYLKHEIIGKSPLGYPIYMIVITDNKVPDSTKKRIWIQARTHSGETQSSYVLEGIIKYLISPENYKQKVINLKEVIFNIIPIVNVDGIAVGNARYTPNGEDLERQWLKQKDNPYELEDSVAQEVKIIHSTIARLSKSPAEFILALNIHGKNALQGESPFLYTNFKKSLKEHGAEGDTIYRNQLMLAKCISDFNNGDSITVQIGYTPSQPMQEKPFPESWWWANFHSQVTAATIEITESRKYPTKDRTDIKGYLDFGAAMAKGLFMFYKIQKDQETDTLKQLYIPYEELDKFYDKNPWE